jgi:hypothetical protein
MILFLEVTAKQQALVQKIRNFLGKWRQLQQKLPLPEMAELHITPQMPEYPKIANDAFMLMLDGKLRSRTEILKFLKPLAPPPPPPPPAPKRGRAAKAAAAGSGSFAVPANQPTVLKKGKAAGAAPAAAPPPAAEVAKQTAKSAVPAAKPAGKLAKQPPAKKTAARSDKKSPDKTKKKSAKKGR